MMWKKSLADIMGSNSKVTPMGLRKEMIFEGRI